MNKENKSNKTCVGQFQKGVIYFKSTPCEQCQKTFADIMVIGSPPLVVK